jgi:hypothetical protein
MRRNREEEEYKGRMKKGTNEQRRENGGEGWQGEGVRREERCRVELR